MELTIVVIMVELVNVSLVGLGDPEVLPRACPWLHTEMSRFPKGPMAKTGLERGLVSMTRGFMPIVVV